MVLAREGIVLAGVRGVDGGIGRVVETPFLLQGVARVADKKPRRLIDIVIHAAGIFGEKIGELTRASVVGQIVEAGQRVAGYITERDIGEDLDRYRIEARRRNNVAGERCSSQGWR